MRYEITMAIQGAPGPFDAVSGFVQYKVSNDHCVPLTRVIGATHPRGELGPPVISSVLPDDYRILRPE